MTNFDPDLLRISTSSTQQVGETTNNAQSSAQQAEDTLAASDDVAALLYLYSAGLPVLALPDYELSIDFKTAVGSGVTAEMASKLFNRMDEATQQIVQDMLDGWLESIEEQAKRTREWLNSPAFEQFLQVRFPEQRPETLVTALVNLEATKAAGVEAASNYARSEADPTTIAIVAGGIVAGTGLGIEFAANAQGPIPAISGQPSVVGEAMPTFQNLINDPNMAAQLGFIGGMLALGATQTASLTTMMTAASKGEKPTSPQAYRAFAEQILKLVKNPAFREHILFRIVDRMPGSEKLSAEQKNEMVAIVNTVLLSSALAGLYKGETNWLGEEVQNLLEGDLAGFFKGGSEEDQKLRQELGQQLQIAYASLSPDARVRLLGALSQYFKSQPTLKQLSDVGRTFDNVTANVTHKELQA